jgi:hypothetical protein
MSKAAIHTLLNLCHKGLLLHQLVTVAGPRPPSGCSMNCSVDRSEENHCSLTWPNVV